MKKILFSLFALIAAFSASAITVDEAYEKISALPGAALSNVPKYDCLKDGMDWGKIVMFPGCTQSTLESIIEITNEITDETFEPEVTSGQGVSVKVFHRPVSDTKKRAIVSSMQSKAGMNIAVIIYCEGGNDMINKLNIN